MARGVIDVIFQTVESIPVIELIHWLCRGIIAEVVSRVFFRTEYRAELTSPDSQFDYIRI